MCVQSVDCGVLVVAHITLPVVAVECMVCSRVFDILLLVPSNLLISDDAVRVTFANHVEDGFAIKIRGTSAGARLEVVSKAASGSVADPTERAGDVGAAMNF